MALPSLGAKTRSSSKTYLLYALHSYFKSYLSADVVNLTQFKRIHRTDGVSSLTPNPVATNKMRLDVMERFRFLAPLPLAGGEARDKGASI